MSPKTARHGKGSRVIPLFPELRPFLEDCLEMAKPGAKYVIIRYRQSNVNLRTQLERIIKRAGVEQWPKTTSSKRRRESPMLVASRLEKRKTTRQGTGTFA